MKLVDVTLSAYIDFGVDNNYNNPKFKSDSHHVRISKYKSIFAKGYIPNWSEEAKIKKAKLKKLKILWLWT